MGTLYRLAAIHSISERTVKGISHAYGGALSALSIYYTLVPIAGKENRWVEREVVSALYVDRQEVLAEEVREVAVRIPNT